MSERDRREIIDLASAEIDRGLADNLGRQANAVSRSSIVVAASGVTGVVQLTSSQSWPSIIVFVLAIVTAGVGLSATSLWNSKAVKVTDTAIREWISREPTDVRQALVRDKLRELYRARADLDRKNSRISWAYGFLIVTWLASFVANVLPMILKALETN